MTKMSVRNSATKKELRIVRTGLLLLLLLLRACACLLVCFLLMLWFFGVVGLFISPLNTLRQINK